jgi:hypothetical protein
MHDWTLLNKSRKDLISKLISDWNELLDKKEKEEVYHSFLSEHAGFFLADETAFAVISKLKLGSELETDFVIIRDGYSNGTIYEFIEIEKPWSKLFNDKGIPSNDFNTSLQQIRDWKRWLIDNKSYFRKYLPTANTRVVNNSNLKFKIIIGRRESPINDFEKRLQIGSENNVEIRSFDSLTDKLSSRFFMPYSTLNDKEKLSDDILTKIANPFSKALTDSDWRELCDNVRIPATHVYSQISDLLVDKFKNNELYRKY